MALMTQAHHDAVSAALAEVTAAQLKLTALALPTATEDDFYDYNVPGPGRMGVIANLNAAKNDIALVD